MAIRINLRSFTAAPRSHDNDSFAVRINLRSFAAAPRSHDNGASQSTLAFGASLPLRDPTTTALRIKRRPCFIVARLCLARAPFGKPPPFCLSPTGKKTPPRRGNNDNGASQFLAIKRGFYVLLCASDKNSEAKK